MGTPIRARRRLAGFSLIEMILVVAIIATLAALLLPAISKGYARGKRTRCLANLKQMGVAFHTFAHDHEDKFPMQVSTNAGGSLEFVNSRGVDVGGAFRSFQALSNHLLDPKILVCPADTRSAADNFAVLRNENISYFVTALAVMGQSESILAGDRNIAATVGTSGLLKWTHELHDGQGNVLYGDARAELMTGASLQGALASSRTIPLFVMPSETGRGESRLGGGGVRDTTANGQGAVSSGDSLGGESGGAAGGKTAPTTGASSKNEGGGKALDRFEQLFQGPPGSKPSVAARSGASGQAEASSGGGSLPVTLAVERVITNKPSMSTNSPAQSLPDVTPGDPWAISFGQFVTRVGSRGAWWLLLFLLTALITVEVIRRRRARNKAKS